jgi:hypothetical protein
MRSITLRNYKSSFLLLLSFLVLSAISVNAQRYSGEAAAVRSTVKVPLLPVLTTGVNDTGPLPSAGGKITLQSASAAVPQVVAVGTSTVTTSGGIPGGDLNTSQSTASIDTLNIAVGGVLPALTVTANTVSSTTQCSCATAACSGNSVITNLRIGGNLVSVTGTVNQTLVVSAGTVTLTLVINERIVSPGSITANALHATFLDSLTGTSTDVVVASAHSDIVCIQAQRDDLYSGRATGFRLRNFTLIPPSSVSTVISDTGFLPSFGGNINVTTAGASLPGILNTGVITSATSGGLPGGNIDTSQSNSSVTDLTLSLLGGVNISAKLLQSHTACQCGIGSEQGCSGDSQVTDLAVSVLGLPVAVNIDGSPNQTINLPLGLGSIIINEQMSSGPDDKTVNALHVILTPLGLDFTDLVIAHSHSDIQCRVIATAAPASVSGRVTDANGRGIPNVIVSARTDGSEVKTAMTNSFGYYQLSNLSSGRNYVLEASSKRYMFAPIVFSLGDNLEDMDFSAGKPEIR